MRDVEALAAADRRTAARTRTGLAAAIVLAMVAGAGGVVAWGQKQRADERTIAAQSARRVAEKAQREAQTERKTADIARGEADIARQNAETEKSRAERNLADKIAADNAASLANQLAEKQKRIADARVLSQSHFLADLARQSNVRGDHGAALLLALQAFSNNTDASDITVAPEAELQLFLALRDLHEIASLAPGGLGVGGVAMFPNNGQIALVDSDGLVHLLNGTTGKQEKTLSGAVGKASALVVSADGRLVAAGFSDGRVHLWRVANAAQPTVLDCGEAVKLLAFSGDGTQIAASCGDAKVSLWNTSDGSPRATISHMDGALTFLVFSADGSSLLGGGWSENAYLWRSTTGELLGKPFPIEKAAPLSSGSFSPDGKTILLTGSNGAAQLWSVKTHLQTLRLVGHGGTVNQGLFLGQGAKIATIADDGTARIWDAQSGDQIGKFDLPDRNNGMGGKGIAVSPDGKYLAAVSSLVSIWAIADGNAVGSFVSDQGEPLSAAFSPNGARILTLSTSNESTNQAVSASLWALQSEARLATFGDARETERSEAAVVTAAISPDETRVATGAWITSCVSMISALGSSSSRLTGVEALRKFGFRRMDAISFQPPTMAMPSSGCKERRQAEDLAWRRQPRLVRVIFARCGPHRRCFG